MKRIFFQILFINLLIVSGCTHKGNTTKISSDKETSTFIIPYSTNEHDNNGNEAIQSSVNTRNKSNLKEIIGGIPYNQHINGKKNGVWIEIDSLAKEINIDVYSNGIRNGQQLSYNTIDLNKIGVYSSQLRFNTDDFISSLIYIKKSHGNIIKLVMDTIKENTDYVDEANKQGFTGFVMQLHGYEFNDYGCPEKEYSYIYGEGIISDIHLIYEKEHTLAENDSFIKDIRFNIARGKLKRGGCQWTRMLVGDRLLHNYYINGEKHGIWVERDSNQIMISRYDHGKINGQRIVYHTPYIADIAFSPYEIGFFEGDRPKLAYVYVKHNIVRTVDKLFKDNESFTREADSLGFKNRGMQFYSAEFDSLGNKLGEGWRIFDYYGGKDFRTESHKVGEWKN